MCPINSVTTTKQMLWDCFHNSTFGQMTRIIRTLFTNSKGQEKSKQYILCRILSTDVKIRI